MRVVRAAKSVRPSKSRAQDTHIPLSCTYDLILAMKQSRPLMSSDRARSDTRSLTRIPGLTRSGLQTPHHTPFCQVSNVLMCSFHSRLRNYMCCRSSQSTRIASLLCVMVRQRVLGRFHHRSTTFNIKLHASSYISFRIRPRSFTVRLY